MKSSIFKTHTGIHIQISADVHIGLRTELFKKQLTMQEAMGEFARLVATGDRRAHKILNDLASRKIQAEIEGLKNTEPMFGELDKDTLYSLIHEEEKDDDDTETDE